MADTEQTSLEAQEQAAAEELTRQTDNREDVVAEAVKAVREARDDVEEEEVQEEVKAEADAEEEEVQEEVKAEADAEEEETGEEVQESILVQNEEGEQLIRLKVDGVDKTMTLAEAQAELQKRDSGSQRLDAAARLKAQAEQELQNARNFLTQQQRAKDQVTTNDQVKANAKAIVDGILSGDEDTAIEKLTAELMRQQGAIRPATLPTDTATDSQNVTAKEQELQAELSRQYETFKTEYPDVFADQTSYDLADMFSEKIEQQHPDWAPLDIMRESGRQVRAYRGTAGPVDTSIKNDVTDNDARQARRNKLKPMPTGGGVEDLQDQPKGRKTPEDIVMSFNKQRRGKTAEYA